MSESLVKGESSLYVNKEVTRGTYVAPSVDADGMEPDQDGLDFKSDREVIERNTISNSIEQVQPRLGTKNITGSVSIELKAGATAGAKPRGSCMYENLLGAVRSVATTTTTKASGNTTSFLAIDDADIAKFNKGDIVLIKKSGHFMVAPVASVVTTSGSAGLNLDITLDQAPGASVVIDKFTTYYHANNEVPLSATYYPGGKIEEQYMGLDVDTASLDGWEAGKTPKINFSLKGLDGTKDVGTPSVSVDFSSDALVPVILGAKAYLGDVSIDYTQIGLSIESTLVDQPSGARASGKVGTRKTKLSISGSINPYTEDDNVDRYNDFNEGVTKSLFFYAYNPTTTDGEFDQVVAFYLPKVMITNMPMGDQDGIFTDNIEFSAFKQAGGDSIFIGFV
jgi:hypothetical protein